MQNINSDSVILSREEFDILVQDAKANREKTMTQKEADAIVYAIRCVKVSDLFRVKDAAELVKTLAGIVKKLEVQR